MGHRNCSSAPKIMGNDTTEGMGIPEAPGQDHTALDTIDSGHIHTIIQR